MIKKTVIGFLVLMALSVTVPIGAQESGRVSEDLTTVSDVLERYIEAIGGREALEAISTRVCTGKEITDLTSRQQPIYESHYYIAYAKIPMSYYTEEWTDAGIYSRGHDGQVGWIKDKCGVVPDTSAGKRRLDWLLNPQNALRIEDYFPDLTLNGTKQIRGYTVYVLESPEFHRPLFFDTTSGLLIGFGHNWELHDYRKAGDILFPHRIVMSRKGGSTTIEFDQVEHSVEVSDSLFTMPADTK